MRGRGVAAALLAGLLALPGTSRADLARGLDLFERGAFAEAAAVLAPEAEAGSPQAQYILGVIYHSAMLPAPEGVSGLALITAAGAAGYLPAQTELARIYRAGDGVAPDPAAMMRWYRRAAEQGDVGAQLFVADGYAFGHGVPRDPVEAYKWYEIAIRYWGPLAVRAREVVAEDMTDAEIAEAVRRAGAWLAAQGAR